MEILLERIKELMQEKGFKSFSQIETACALGPQTLSKWATHTPSIEKVSKVAQLFDVSVDYIIGKTDIKKPAEHLTQQEQDILDLIRNDPALRAYVLELQYRHTHDPSHYPAANGTTK